MKIKNCSIILLVTSTVLYAADDDSKAPEFRNYSPAAESLVQKMIKTMKDCKSYADEAEIRYESSSQYFQMNEMPMAVSFARNGRIKFKSNQYEVYADGKEVTVFDVSIRRYIVKPVEKEFTTQVRPYVSSFMPGLSPAEMLVAVDPRVSIASMIRDLDMSGYEEIDGFRCGRLEGYLDKATFSFGGEAPENVPVTLWIDMVNNLLRRVMIDQSISDDDDNNSGWRGVNDLKIVLDVKNARLNAKFESDTFKFDPPASAKKVDRFYTMSFMGGATGASQFEMSGKKTPEFNLETHNGQRLSDREMQGKVSALIFMPDYPGAVESMVSRLNEKVGELVEAGLNIVVVWPSGDAESVADKMAELHEDVTVLLDADGDFTKEFPGEAWSKGIVLIGKDGVVQGKYPLYLNDQSLETFKADIAKLKEGKSLESAKEMTEEERKEAVAQRSQRFYGDVAEEHNADAITETWKVTVESSGMSFSMSTGGAVTDDRGFWVRTRKGVSLVGNNGEMLDEIEFQDFTVEGRGWERFVVGDFRGRTGVVMMNSIPGEEDTNMGWTPPKGARFTGFDGSGNRLWEMEVEVSNQQVPQQMAMGNVDGRGSDELVFFHKGALWVVDERGEIMAKRVCGGWISWLRIEDRDNNRRDEIYVGTNTGVTRYDFR